MSHQSSDKSFKPVTRAEEAPSESYDQAPWRSTWRVLTPQMREAGGRLGVVRNVLPPGNLGCPFHWHALEDEVFFVLSGRAVLRYGSELEEVGPGDCVACPAGRQVAHQFVNPFDEPFEYLAIGAHEPHEVCGYPDSGKIMVRHLGTVGELSAREYMDAEPDPPLVFQLMESRKSRA